MLWFCSALGACGGEAPSSPPPALPPLKLTPGKPALEAIVAAAPGAPSERRLTELRELLGAAFEAGAADPRTAERALRSLRESEDAPYALEVGLTHADANVRSNAAFELGRVRAHGALPALVLRLKYETDPRARVWVAAALWQLGNGAALEVLRAAMGVEATAESAGGPSVELLRAMGRELPPEPSWEHLRGEVLAVARQWRATGVPLLAIERTPKQDALLRANLARRLLAIEGFQLRAVDDARFVLARLGVEPLALLRLALGAEELYLRNHALEVVAALGSPGRPLVDMVLPLLADRTSEPFAMAALGAIGARESLPHLLARLASDDPELRAGAAEALGGLGMVEAQPVLRTRLRSPDEILDVRVRAAASLARLEGGGEGLAFLEERKKSGDYHAPTIEELLERVRPAR